MDDLFVNPVCMYLDVRDICALERVNKVFNRLCKEKIWKLMCKWHNVPDDILADDPEESKSLLWWDSVKKFLRGWLDFGYSRWGNWIWMWKSNAITQQSKELDYKQRYLRMLR